MKRSLIQIQLQQILSEVGLNSQNLKLNSTGSDDIGLDSFDMIFYLHNLESKFNIELADNELQNLNKIDNTINLLDKKLNICA